MVSINSGDFPFTIMDVASLLRLNIRRRGPGHVYADCPICGDRRGKMNMNLEKNVWRCNYCNEGGGMLALYAKVYGISNSDAYREICETLQTEGFEPEYAAIAQTQAPMQPQSQRASAREVHQTYSMLLSMLSLTPAHQEHLRIERGLTMEQIEQFGFKSTPPTYLCRSLTERLMAQGCTVQGVPGFYVNDSGHWTMKFSQRTAGILIPIRGVDAMICGMQIRLNTPIKAPDDPPEKAGSKYLWFSSSGKNMGTTSGSPVHFIGDPCARVVYVIEGGLKGYICHALMGRTFAATAGANNVNHLDALFAFLRKNGTEEIIEAADMDKYRNEMVDNGASKIYLMARKNGLSCRRLTWNPNYKGMDDWQFALRRKKSELKEDQTMNFKEQYLFGRCSLDHIEACIERWHQLPEDGVPLIDYLGLTQQEYDVYLQTDLSTTFRQILDGQRCDRKFRIYQLDFEDGKPIPFAFAGLDALRKAGYEQPPAAAYRLIHDGELTCPKSYKDEEILNALFERFNAELSADYLGRSLSVSDVVELYGDGFRIYFYRDVKRFERVRFSPMLAKPMRK